MAFENVFKTLENSKATSPSSTKSVPTKVPINQGPAIQNTQTKPNILGLNQNLLPQPQTGPTPQPDVKFGSGGVLNAALDFLQIPYYGYTGFLKGMRQDIVRQRTDAGIPNAEDITQNKGQGVSDRGSVIKAGLSNIIPGITQRQGMGNEPQDLNVGKDLGIKNPTLQAGYNLATSLAIPSVPVGKLVSGGGKILSKIPGVTKVAEKVAEKAPQIAQTIREIPLVEKVGTKFNPFFKVPELEKMVQASSDVRFGRLRELISTLRTTTKGLTPQEQVYVGRVLEGTADLSKEPALMEKFGPIVDELRTLSNKIGQEAVDQGLMKAETFNKMKNKYLTHIFEGVGQADRGIPVGSKIPAYEGSFFKQRTGTEGYVQQFAPAMFKGLGTEISDIEASKFYREVAKRFGIELSETKPLPEGFSIASEALTSKRGGKFLKNIGLPNDVVEALTKNAETFKPNAYDKVLGLWKAGKTIWNPAYHVRNLFSNIILSDMSTGRGLLPSTIDFVNGLRKVVGPGDEFTAAAEKAGLIKLSSFQENLDDFMKEAGLVDETAKVGGKVEVAAKNLHNVLKQAQTTSEEAAKVSVFKSWINKFADDANKSVTEVLSDPEVVKKAVGKAEEAIFSPYRIGKQERSLASRLFPFYSFTRQALPFTAKTAINNPDRIVKYPKIFEGIESLSPQDAGQEGILPSYRQGQVRLPIKNKEGNNLYWDPQYILPFGSFNEGDLASGKLPLGLSLNPFWSEPFQLLNNYDTFTGRPISQSPLPEDQTAATVKHAANFAAPTFLANVFNKIVPGITGKPDPLGRKRDLPTSVIDTVLGIKGTYLNPSTEFTNSVRQIRSEITSASDEIKRVSRDQSIPPAEKEAKVRRLVEFIQQQGIKLQKLNSAMGANQEDQ